jgi:predicted nucleotidyltransferase
MDAPPIELPLELIADYCRRYPIARLSLFGSAARGALSGADDIDLLVEFDPGATVGFLLLARIQHELELLLGYPVDLVPASGLKPLIRDEVLASSRVIYAA